MGSSFSPLNYESIILDVGDLSPLSEAGLITCLQLAREYQQALLPNAAGQVGARRALEAISALEARIRTSALDLVMTMGHIQSSITLLQDFLGENAELLSGPEISGLMSIAGITSTPGASGSGASSRTSADSDATVVPAGVAAVEEDELDESMGEPTEPVATSSAPPSVAPSEANTEASSVSNKTV